jgi:hypothetical protein
MREENALYITPDGLSAMDAVRDVLGPRIDAITNGTWTNLAWPWATLTDRARSLMPGTITVMCGDPGATKSLLLLSAMYFWHCAGTFVALMALEGGPELHLQRLFSMLVHSWDVLDPKWGRNNSIALQAMYADVASEIDSFAKRLSSAPPGQLRYKILLEWIEKQLDGGAKIVGIDPITFVATGESRQVEDLAFISSAAKLIEEYGARLILVTHPRGNARKSPGMQDMAGGMSFSRHTQTVLWLASGEKSVSIKTAMGPQRIKINRMLRILKCTNGPGQGDRIGFILGKEVEFAEQGLIETEHKFEG